MLIRFHLSGLTQTRWYENISRFFFGGVITVLTGLIALAYGPTVGGLFLAFPAVLPASASLIEKHQREKKERAGLAGTIRGRRAAASDAAGAAMGSAGLAVFALVSYKLLPRSPAWITLAFATLGWAAAAGMMWYVRKRRVPQLRRFLRKRARST